MNNVYRVQRTRLKGWKKPENTLDVTRPARGENKWSNPFRVKEYGREKAVELFKTYIDERLSSGELNISELRGKNLMCWCDFNGACHADYLLELANK
jgi:hypothetical protein